MSRPRTSAKTAKIESEPVGDEVLRRMLKTPPKKHADQTPERAKPKPQKPK